MGVDRGRKRRSVPEQRRRYGNPESRKELLLRLSEERAQRAKETQMAEQASLRNPDEFHFGFYSHRPDMSRTRAVPRDELRKVLRYVDCEIKRCRDRLDAPSETGQRRTHEGYLRELVERRREVADRLSKQTKNK